ncbi:MAG: hypothetical protein AAFX08_06690 [Pseudomonadota bacterium]
MSIRLQHPSPSIASARLDWLAGWRASEHIAFAALAAMCALIAFGAPLAAFTVDDFFYAQMAAAMAEEARLTFQQLSLPGATSIDMELAGPAPDGRLAPQYPSGYALLAAPFYALFGLRGLILLNATAFLASAYCVWRLAINARFDRPTAALAVGLFSFCSIAPTYAFAIWPHMAALAFYLWALLLTIGAPGSARPRARLCAAGLVLGFALSVRADAILPMIAVFVWLRLFSGLDRKHAGAFVVGLLPGLFACALLNFAKFGVFAPISYNKAEGATALGDYALLQALVYAALATLLIVNPAWLGLHRISSAVWRRDLRWPIIGAAVIIIIGLLMIGPSAQIAKGFYALLIDLQVHPFEIGHCVIKPDAAGVYTFCGLYKRALLQSMPFLGLAVLALACFPRSASRREEALLWLAAAAFVAFYALKAWHGGLSVNMRYLAPSAAILCVLVAPHAMSIIRRAALTPTQAALAATIGYAASLLAADSAPPAFYGWTFLYPPMALGLAVALVALASPFDARPRLAGLSAALVVASIGASAGNAAQEALIDRKIRARFAAAEALLEARLEPGALLITSNPAQFTRLALEGRSIVNASIGQTEILGRTVALYLGAGRAVYVDDGGLAALRAGAAVEVNKGSLSPEAAPSLTRVVSLKA